MDGTAASERPPRIFVISDVHIGAGELDDFVPCLQESLLKFLGVLARLPQVVELVINGDFFDFATAEPWDDPLLESRSAHDLPLCFTEGQSCRKLENIIEGHGPVFDALARLLSSKPHNRITMLPGNHDADLFWPKVRQRILERLTEATGGDTQALEERIFFVLESHYVIQRSETRYWIEHGHQHDPPNSFFPGGQERWSMGAPPIFVDTQQQWRLYECPGTLGLVRHINHWRRTYHSISYIKPFSRVLLALITHRAFKEPRRPLMVLRHLVAMLGWDVDLKTTLSVGDDVMHACHDVVQTLLENLTPHEEQELVSFLGERGLAIDTPLAIYVTTAICRQRIIDCIASEAPGRGVRQGIQVISDTLGLAANGLFKDIETQALVQMARRLINEKKADYVLTGHTHDPCQKLGASFSNGGSWIPNLVADSTREAKHLIFAHGLVRFKMNYLEIESAGPPLLRTFCQGTVRI